jgi:chemosensory pili system protein ChpA (sensor histidine kinase/response regulator)
MPKILVVDDDIHFQVIMRRMLEGEGYEVAIAPDGDTALEMLRTDEPPDLILLDVMMATTLEGIDVAREIKADPALENLPIIMVSSISTSPYASDFPDDEHIPIDGWITKPVQRNVLLKILDHFVAEGSKDES